MQTPFPIHKKACWRIPLLVILMGYALLGILAACGVSIPEFHSSVYLKETALIEETPLSVSRWWDPVFLGILASYFITGLYLAQLSKEYQKNYLKNLIPGMFFGLFVIVFSQCFNMISQSYEANSIFEGFHRFHLIAYLIVLGIIILFSNTNHVIRREELFTMTIKDGKIVEKWHIPWQNTDLLDKLPGKSFIIGYAISSSVLVGFLPSAIIVTGYLALIIILTILYNVWINTAKKIDASKMTAALRKSRKEFSLWLGFGHTPTTSKSNQ